MRTQHAVQVLASVGKVCYHSKKIQKKMVQKAREKKLVLPISQLLLPLELVRLKYYVANSYYVDGKKKERDVHM